MKNEMIMCLAACAGLLVSSCCRHAETEEVWIENGDRNIYGVLSRPATKTERQPLLIVSHGFNGSHQFGKNYFELLNELGYQCYVFDFGCGSLGSRTDNNTMEMSVIDECGDLKAVIEHFRNRPDVDPDRIVLLGESQGGLITAMVANEMPDAVSSLILVFPAFCIPENWTRSYPDINEIPDTTWLWDVPLGRRFFTELRGMSVYDDMEKFDGPVLIIQGDKDPIVSMEDSRRALGLYKNARLHVIPGAGHGFKPEEFAEQLEQMRKFLK